MPEKVPDKKLTEALLELQDKALAAKQTGKNPHFNRSYSTLEDVWQAARSELGRLKLVVSQTTVTKDDKTFLITKVTHVPSGDSIESSTPVVWGEEKGRSIMQSLGSAITYARRYGLVTALGIIIEDDDASTAGGSKGGGSASATSDVPATDPQKGKIRVLLEKKTVSLEARNALDKKLSEGTLTKSEASTALDKLEAADDKDKGADPNAAESKSTASESGEDDGALDDIPF